MRSARHAVSFALALSCLAIAAARTSAAPSNDDCAAATTISAVPFSADVDTSSATTAAADPVLCGGAPRSHR